ncbi:hypothetical protein FACS1894195_2840 [Bacteroidia bacterium]|nr:hypothetical protein FACS1894195_2840 [Bacteroidia bacterium]
MNYEIVGKLVFKENTQQLTERFQKREFVIEVANERDPQWNDFIKIQLTQDRCDLIETINLEEQIKVHFNLRGRKWEKDGRSGFITNLEGWRIEKLAQETPSQAAPTASNLPEYAVADIAETTETDDLPF